VLAAAAGVENQVIAQTIGADANTVGKWRRRFAEHRIDGVYDEPPHCQINLCRAEERPTEYLITLQQPHCSIDLRPRLGRPGASSVRRDGVAG
jgi:hypothetical protein